VVVQLDLKGSTFWVSVPRHFQRAAMRTSAINKAEVPHPWRGLVVPNEDARIHEWRQDGSSIFFVLAWSRPIGFWTDVFRV
jgi:hypothetical protein